MAQIEMDKCVKVLAEQAEEWGFGGKNQVLTALYKFLKRQREIVCKQKLFSLDPGTFSPIHRLMLICFEYSDDGMKKIREHRGFNVPQRQEYIDMMTELWLEYLFSKDGEALKFDRKPEERPEKINKKNCSEETESDGMNTESLKLDGNLEEPPKKINEESVTKETESDGMNTESLKLDGNLEEPPKKINEESVTKETESEGTNAESLKFERKPEEPPTKKNKESELDATEDSGDCVEFLYHSDAYGVRSNSRHRQTKSEKRQPTKKAHGGSSSRVSGFGSSSSRVEVITLSSDSEDEE